MDRVLEATELVKHYRDGSGLLTVLHGISFTVTPGTVVAIVGPSGSGKSTLLNVLSGLDTPSSGAVRICGQDLSSLGPNAAADFRRRHIGFVFQFFNLIPTMSAHDNVALPLLAEGLRRRDIDTRANAAISEVGLSDKRDQPASKLSGGEMQRVAIARALVMNPPLVLADEPTGNLDSVTGDRILQLLCTACRHANRSVVMVTHSHLAAAYADRVLVMRDGRIVEEVSAAQGQTSLLSAGRPRT